MNNKDNVTEIHQTLSDLSSEIIHIWEQKIRSNIARTKGKSSIFLIDHIPNILHNLTEVLKHDGVRIKREETNRLNKGHGTQRATESDFSLEDLMLEYNLLREIIIDQLRSKAPIDAIYLRIINQFMNESIETTVLEYYRVQTNIIKKQAEDLEIEKENRGRFIAALSHDMRTPLTAAMLSTELILRKLEPSELQSKHLLKISQNLHRLDSMIQDFLDVNLLKAGRPVPTTYSTFNLNTVVKEVLSDLEIIYGERFKIIAQDSIDVQLDQKSVKRIIENLCSNAIKYGSAHDTVTIKIRFNKVQVFIDVHNMGDPIDKETLANIFQFFSRSNSAWAKNTKGWGIGLALVKGLTESQNGEIKIETNKESGTTFTLCFPQKPSPS